MSHSVFFQPGLTLVSYVRIGAALFRSFRAPDSDVEIPPYESAGILPTELRSTGHFRTHFSAPSADTIYGVGSGKIYVSTDYGGTWSWIFSDSIVELNSVHAPGKLGNNTNTDFFVAVGSVGCVVRGTTLSPNENDTTSVILAGNSVFRDVHFVDGFKGIIVGESSEVWRTVDSGQSWSRIDLSSLFGTRHAIINKVFYQQNSVVYALASKSLSESFVIKSVDDGQTWSIVHSDSVLLFDLYFVNPNRGYVVGQNGLMIMTTDGGQSWRSLGRVNNENLYSVRFLTHKPDEGYIVGAKGTFIKVVNTDVALTPTINVPNTTSDVSNLFFLYGTSDTVTPLYFHLRKRVHRMLT